MNSQAKVTIATNIRRGRLEKGLTQRELANKLDIESVLVSKWERGAHRPSDKNLAALASVYELPIAWFLTEHEEQAA